uniref:ATP synthase subunit a n=1 Tax=Laternula elliptica TaxID=228457 RepID=U5TTU7_LATEL|nr:ATP synthase F0 subunit 6 [Laternula elliptica]AGZ13058.1 ATP synthase F0 subunit 6 [Laternula elliptica]AQZ26138.1 ATP synthase subunit 6 [Laternula elliptica]
MSYDLFSVFDESNFSQWSSLWMLALWGLVIYGFFGGAHSITSNGWSGFTISLKRVFWGVSPVRDGGGKKLGGFYIILISVFIFVLGGNLYGLLPYAFSWTSHMVVAFSLAIPMWVSIVVSGFTWNWGRMAAGLFPAGSGLGLSPILVVSETVSNFLRPMSLGFRLSINMTAGHIFLGVVGGAALWSWSTGSLVGLLSWGAVLGLTLVEWVVCFLQSYIFFLLLTLYLLEHS